jgi:hypothetical protein
MIRKAHRPIPFFWVFIKFRICAIEITRPGKSDFYDDTRQSAAVEKIELISQQSGINVKVAQRLISLLSPVGGRGVGGEGGHGAFMLWCGIFAMAVRAVCVHTRMLVLHSFRRRSHARLFIE